VTKDEYLERLINNRLDVSPLVLEEDILEIRKMYESYVYDRGLLELWCDKHNHKLSLIRTILSGFNLMAASLVALKVFEVI
jgi:hypothetical protein